MTRVLVTGFAFLFALCTAAGQQRAAAELRADDPELYFGFFSLHQAQLKMVADAKAAETAGAKPRGDGLNDMDSVSLREGFVRQLGITEADYDRVSAISMSVLDRIDGINQTAAKLRDEILAARTAGQARPNSADQAEAMALQQQRIGTLRDGMKQLQSTLSSAGWSTLHSCINDDYRSHILRKELPHAHQ